MTRFTDAMWAEIRPTFEAILDLPFNRELAAGTLSRERFVFYMVQDAHYLGAFARALATAAAKATTPEAQVTFATSAHEAIVVEKALHEGFFREFGVSDERFAAAPNPYQRWIDTYRDEAFGEAVRRVLAHTEEVFVSSAEGDRALMRESYLKAGRYEWMFWDSAYRMEVWPI
jgi:thiaminase/transcriptional activator TenA